MRVKELNIRGFIEGIEVPIIAATVSMAPNSPASAAVQIIATDRAHEIKPRSVVHLFFKDFYEGPSPKKFIAGEGIESAAIAEKYNQIFEEESYKLLFCGEIMAYQFAKQADVRQITLQCADFSIYWDTCWYFSGGGFFSPASMKKRFSLASGGFFENLILNKGEEIYKEFTTPPEGFPGVTGLLGGLIHLMQSVGGVYWKGATKFGGLNPFFSISELKFHITQQIAAADDDGPKRLLRTKGFGSIWNRSIKGLGKNFTYRMVINALQRYIFYEVFPCPVARYIPGTGIYDDQDRSTKLLRNHPTFSYHVVAAGQHQKAVQRLIEDFVSSPRKLSRKEYRSSLITMRKAMKVDSAKAKKDNILNVVKMYGTVRGRIKTLLQELKKKLPGKGKNYNSILKHLNFIDNQLGAVYDFVVPATRTVTKTKDLNVVPSTVVVTTEASRPGFEGEIAPIGQGETVQRAYTIPQPIVFGKDVTYKVLAKTKVEGKPPFLMNQLFRPDVWFTSPPRCNVIFPEQYNSITFSRNYMGEVTRLLLRTHSSFYGSSLLFDKYYYAPAIPGEKAKAKSEAQSKDDKKKSESTDTKKKKVPGLLQKGYEGLVKARRDVLEHELYTGVLPKFERAGSHKVLGLRTGTTLQGGVDVGYAQRLANFLFFKYRFAARQMMVSGPFNPYLAPGFPAVVIDKPVNQDKIKDIIKQLSENAQDISSIKGMTGTHYLGMIVGMNHSVSQQGGQTDVQLQYARTHREEVEALGADIIKKQKIQKTTKTKVKRTVEIPAQVVEIPLPEGQVGPTETVTILPAQKFTWYEDRPAPKPVQSYVCALSKPSVGRRGLFGGKIKEVKEIDPDKQVFTKEKKVEEFDVPIAVPSAAVVEGKAFTTRLPTTRTETKVSVKKQIRTEFPLLGTLIKKKSRKAKWKKKFDTLVQPWIRKPAGEFGPEIVGLVGSSTALVEFKLFWILEDVIFTEEEEVDQPLEDIIRPSWYSTIWLNRKIGGAVYDKFFGTTAITDPLSVVADIAIQAAPDQEEEAVAATVADADDETGFEVDLPSIQDIEQGTSIEAAVDAIAYIYSVIKERSFGIDEFLRAYTWRPVASMIDMFGTPDLRFAYGKWIGDKFIPGEKDKDPVVAIEGIEGFHSRAFGDYKDLFGLVGPAVGQVIGIENRFDPQNSRLDVRRERWLRVLAYVTELNEKGLLG